MPLSDATLITLAGMSVGTPVTDDTDFTAMTPAQVAAKYALSSYGGDAGSSLYAPGADGDYDALDPDDPPVTDLGLWAVGAFINYAVNGLLTGAGTLEYQAAGKQVVKNVGYHPPVLALSAAATTTKLAAITQREVAVWKPFVKVIKATTGEDPGANQVFYSLSRSADELIEVYRATSTDQMTLKIRSGGVDYTKALGSVADNTAFSVAINVFASFTAASLDGGTVQVLTAPKPSGVLTLESIGCKHDGTLQCGGPIAECNLIHPAVWTAAQLEAA